MSGCQRCQGQHVEAVGPAGHLLYFRRVVLARNQRASPLKNSSNLDRVKPIAIPAQCIRPDQNAVGLLDVPIVKLGRSLLNRISLRDWCPCLALLAEVNEPRTKIGRELTLDLARSPHNFASGVE